MPSRKACTDGILYLRAAGLRWTPPLRGDADVAATTAVLAEALGDLTDAELGAAVKVAVRTQDDWPTPRQLREIASEVRRDAAAKLPVSTMAPAEVEAARAIGMRWAARLAQRLKPPQPADSPAEPMA